MGTATSDTVRIGGKMLTLGRARAMGYVNADGTPTEKGLAAFGVERPSTAQPVRNRDRKAKRESAAGEPQVSTDGKPVARKRVEPLRPKNVKDGVPVEDPAIIAQRIADAEAAEAAKTKLAPNPQAEAIAAEAREAAKAESQAAHAALAEASDEG